MRQIEIFYDSSLPLTIDGVRKVLLHIVTKRMKGFAYVVPCGAWDMKRRDPKYPLGSQKVEAIKMPPTQKMDPELMPLMPAWVPENMGAAFNLRGQLS